MTERQFEHVKVVIVPADQPHVAIMNFVTQGRGDVLPLGAAWIGNGWWIREADRELIELSILKWRQIGAGLERPAPLRWFIAKEEDIPADRTYRNAQVAHETEARVVHHMPLARELHRDLLREERTRRLLVLDVAGIIAARTGPDTVEDVDAEKQVLLDAPDDPRIEAAQTIEELKAVTLDGMLQEAQARGLLVRARTAAADPV